MQLPNSSMSSIIRSEDCRITTGLSYNVVTVGGAAERQERPGADTQGTREPRLSSVLIGWQHHMSRPTQRSLGTLPGFPQW